MAVTQVARTIDTTADTLWRCVRAFGDVPWAGGGLKIEVRGEGVGQVRIIDLPAGRVHEQLTSLDDQARSLTYVTPVGNPVPVTKYEARMTVTDDHGKGRLTWSCTFEPDGVSESEAARDLQRRYDAAIRAIEAYLSSR